MFILSLRPLFCLVDDAKVRRLLSDSKKSHGFFSNLSGQRPKFWPNRQKCSGFCPKPQKKFCFLAQTAELLHLYVCFF